MRIVGKTIMVLVLFMFVLPNQSIKIDCYGTQGSDMDILVGALDEFKCPLYDPQIPERYDGVE
jgi:hypothetical protein